jgi:glycerophosphoryl diester phosphodiesterase
MFAFSCNSTKKLSTYKNTGFDTQAHRGGRGLFPENTIPAMLNALALGVQTLEMDVVITGDKKVVLSHEPFFSKEITTTASGASIEGDEKEHNIYQMDYALVKTYDVGMRAHPLFPDQQKLRTYKPLLSEVFEAVKNYMMTARRPFPFYNIETKTTAATDGKFHPAPAEFVDLLMAVIAQYQLQEQVIIQSFDTRTLKYLHKKYPSIKTALLIEANNNYSFRKQVRDLGFNPDIYSPEASLVTANLIKEVHDIGIKIIPWTVNEKTKIKEFKTMGVDGVISDYPDRF